MKATKFTIDRSRWACGASRGTWLLGKNDEFQCCLGFYASACGVTANALRGRVKLDQLPWSDIRSRLHRDLVVVEDTYARDTALHGILIQINDAPGMPAAEREKAVADRFAEAGITVEFTGEYPS